MTDIATRIRERLDWSGVQPKLRDFAGLLLELHADGDFGPDEEARQWWRGWNACHRSLVEALATKLGISDSPAEAGPQPTPAGDSIDWRRVAVKLARTGVGFWGLTTPERDALVVAVEENAAIDADRRFVDTADAADQGER